jgi:hypothetical protein
MVQADFCVDALEPCLDFLQTPQPLLIQSTHSRSHPHLRRRVSRTRHCHQHRHLHRRLEHLLPLIRNLCLAPDRPQRASRGTILMWLSHPYRPHSRCCLSANPT